MKDCPSLGGKQACLVCANKPELVQSAVIVDIFPTNFTSTLLDETCTALLLLDILNLQSRNEASRLLANQIKVNCQRAQFLLLFRKCASTVVMFTASS